MADSGAALAIAAAIASAASAAPAGAAGAEVEAPGFSAAEMQRRRTALADALAEIGASHALIVGTDRRMSALQWLTGYPSNNLNMGIVSPGEQDLLLVPYPNHVAQAEVIAPDCKVIWNAKGAAAIALETLSARGTRG